MLLCGCTSAVLTEIYSRLYRIFHSINPTYTIEKVSELLGHM